MKNLIWIACFIPLLIIINAEYKFGDIIAFSNTRDCPCKKPFVEHYAIYVGNEPIDGKKPDENIFHRTGQSKDDANCIFGKFDDTKPRPVKNYLDDKKGITVGNHAEILSRIKEKHNNCEDYNSFTDNCEHLATYVRYGEKHSQQRGTHSGAVMRPLDFVCSLFRSSEPTEELPIPEDYEVVSCDEICKHEADRKSG
ncbi:hypothetical protein EXN66_Car014047 [Channa argus]|uniref:LRAT domain-containing protein n=1 Tax=Channa argus TaxID=215402 RepID=A0A6G1Q880_CHAAH|nr:hypothetical protein EXN66_Car014047 [Channa argus]